MFGIKLPSIGSLVMLVISLLVIFFIVRMVPNDTVKGLFRV